MGGSRRGGRWSRLGGLRTHTRGCDARGPLVAPRTRERAPVPAPRPRRPRAAGAERRRARAAGAKRLHRRTLTIEARDDVPTLTGRVDDAPQGGRSRGRSIQIDRRLTACMREYASTASIGFFRAAQGYMYILVHLSLGDVLVSPLLSPQDTSRDISWSQRESRCKHPKNRASSRSVSTPPPPPPPPKKSSGIRRRTRLLARDRLRGYRTSTWSIYIIQLASSDSRFAGSQHSYSSRSAGLD